MSVRQAFADQARSCRALGSELTARVTEILGTALDPAQGPVARRILDWQGNPGPGGDSVPLRLAGGLHALVLTGRAPDLALAYRRGDPSAALLLDSIAAHENFLMGWLDSPPQTNEVARSAAIIAAARFLTALYPRPIAALELGSSAGLNLNFWRYHLLPDGPRDGVILSPDWRGDLPDATPNVVSARGVDLRPIDAVADSLRLLAYCWADQTMRLDRLRAAIELARTHPPQIDQGDAADWIEARLAEPATCTRMVFHTVAWQYFPAATQARITAALNRAGQDATPATPLALFGMEADAGGNGAALTLRIWAGRLREFRLGRADFHGRWIDWRPEETG